MKKIIFAVILFVVNYTTTYAEVVSTYGKNQFGLMEKTGEIRETQNGKKEIYHKNEYGLMEKQGEIRQNSFGGYDVYNKNQYGLMEKTGEIK